MGGGGGFRKGSLENEMEWAFQQWGFDLNEVQLPEGTTLKKHTQEMSSGHITTLGQAGRTCRRGFRAE